MIRQGPSVSIQQPVCTDRLTVSRERLQRIAGAADAFSDADPCLERGDYHYGSGVSDLIAYLLNPDEPTPAMARLLNLPEVPRACSPA